MLAFEFTPQIVYAVDAHCGAAERLAVRTRNVLGARHHEAYSTFKKVSFLSDLEIKMPFAQGLQNYLPFLNVL